MTAVDPLLDTTIGPYRIDARIGTGATGIVYRATPVDGGSAVALKVLHDNLGSIGGLEQRFAREARLLRMLHHPNIVEIAGFGTQAGRTYIAMELLEGKTLEDYLQERAIEPARGVRVCLAVVEALADAHEQDVVHRDLKPANVFLSKDGGVKLLDFGLAKSLSVESQSIEEGMLTKRGRIVGTPAYMAPEQITGISIDVRADVYALGVMLYELLADRRPFPYERRSQLLRAHLLEPVPPITSVRPGLWVHEALDAVIMKALDKNPDLRFPNGRAMLDAMRALPDECVREPVRSEVGARAVPERARSSASSEVITDEERRAITREVEHASRPPRPRQAVVQPVTEPERPAMRRRGVDTSTLFAVAAVLFAMAAALWLSLLLRV